MLVNYSIFSLLAFVALINITVLGEEFNQKTKIIDDDVLRLVKQKKLVTLLVEKPKDCNVFTEKNDEVEVHYTGYLENGNIFDSSEQSGKDPIKFVLGSGHVIKGWDEGLMNMCPGERRRLIIPPDLAYGKKGYHPVIPPDATLLFEVTLVSLVKDGLGSSLGDLQNLVLLIKFFFLPAVIIYLFVYMYRRYRAETEAAKEQRRGKNNRKRR